MMLVSRLFSASYHNAVHTSVYIYVCMCGLDGRRDGEWWIGYNLEREVIA
jgi:hypothetical protein